MADDDGLSEYERDRLVNIASNEEVMRILGLSKLIEPSPAPKKQKVSAELTADGTSMARRCGRKKHEMHACDVGIQ